MATAVLNPVRKQTQTRKTSVALWIIQGLLAALFLFAGGTKLLTPSDALAAMMPLPVAFVKFIGVCEVLGAFGLVLPAALGIRRELTALAAAGLLVIMIGATVLTPMLMAGDVVLTAIPAVVGVLAGVVAYGRRA